ncbi:hypothetical protein [Xanthomonas graminis]|jgi:hypothetical protein|nr:hypothetical protein [Xanthomonas translucens]
MTVASVIRQRQRVVAISGNSQACVFPLANAMARHADSHSDPVISPVGTELSTKSPLLIYARHTAAEFQTTEKVGLSNPNRGPSRGTATRHGMHACMHASRSFEKITLRMEAFGSDRHRR